MSADLEFSPPTSGAGSLRMPLAPVDDARLRVMTSVATVVAALVLIVAQVQAAVPYTIAVAVLVVAAAWGWPGLIGSYTPGVAGALLAVIGVLVVTAMAFGGPAWSWALGTIGLGLLVTFLRQLTRPAPRDGLVLSLLAAVSGVVVATAGAMALAIGTDPASRGAMVVAAVAAAASLIGDVAVASRGLRAFASLIAAVAAMIAGIIAARVVGQPSLALALGLGGGIGSLSFVVRRVVSQAPAILGWPGQVAAGVASVLLALPLAWGALELI